MKILYSHECSELLPQIVSHIMKEWDFLYEFEGEDYDTVIKSLNMNSDPDQIPITLVAVEMANLQE